MSTTRECIVCGSVRPAPLYTGILACRACGHVFADLEISDEELLRLYGKSYFFGDEYSDYLADKGALQKNFRLRMRTLDTFMDSARHRRLLEIGCAYGFFLEVAHARFEEVMGIDIAADGVRHAQDTLQLNAIQGDFLAHDFGGRKFDVVCLWDTIEHLRDPHLYIEKAASCTDSGALLTITTGDIESLAARIKRDKWRLLHPPTHLHYFSPHTLSTLLDRYGFEVVYNRYCGFYRSIDNIAYNILVLRKQQHRLYDFLRKSGLTKLDFYLNVYDIMYVVARRRR